MPDLHRFVQAVEDAFGELLRLAGGAEAGDLGNGAAIEGDGLAPGMRLGARPIRSEIPQNRRLS
jgi:hypothetical protein